MKRLISILSLTLITNIIAAQTAIRGKLIDDATGEPMLFANVGIKGTTIGAISDFDGNFSLESSSLTTGSYDIQVSFVSYNTKVIEGVKVTEGEVTLLGEIRMEPASEQLQKVVISAEAVKNSETAMLTMKKKSATMIDGISSEEMKLIGDGTASEAATRVTGVTVEGGKYVYVRGLGDRYSKTTLNGVDIPGLDPDRNTLQMDIFPTNLIDNITISKNFTADKPADFTGGLVNIDIKDLPEKRIFDVSAKIGYNPQYHLTDNYIQYEGGATDFLGFDDGTRALPNGAKSQNFPTPFNPDYSTEEVNAFNRSFNPTLGAENRMSGLDFDLGITFGNQKSLGKDKEEGEITNSKDPKLGYILSASYKSDYAFYDEVIYAEFQRDPNPDNYELIPANYQEGEVAERSFLVGLLGGIAYKTNLSKIRLMAMHLQSGESRSGKFILDNNAGAAGQSGYQASVDNLEYNQRSLSNLLINGKHVLHESGWEIDWRVSPTLSISKDPDIRKTAFTLDFRGPWFSPGDGGLPSRIWRDLFEINVVSKIDLTKKYVLSGRNAKLKFGAVHTYKYRDYEILSYGLRSRSSQYFWPEADANIVLLPENIYPNEPNLWYNTGNIQPNPNEYQSTVNNIGIYVSNEWKLTERLNTILGVRMENYVQTHTGRDIKYAGGDFENGNNLDNAEVLNSTDFFPSVSLIYQLKEDMNLRGSYTQTIARPSFKELSFAQIIDPFTNRIFNGSLFEYNDWDGNLVETRIQNVDLRWEWFFKGDQTFSVSGFAKIFDQPIELVRIPEQQTSTEYQARNVGSGQLAGIEIEFRKNFKFISDKLKNFKLNGNVTLVQSRIDMTDREFNWRTSFARTGETIENTRQMAGQAPWVVNAGLVYGNLAYGFDAGLFYNVKGPTLTIVGLGLYPDIYSEPFHSLNFSFNKTLGVERNTKLAFRIENLLNDRREEFFQSYPNESAYFTTFNPGVTFSLGVTHKF